MECLEALRQGLLRGDREQYDEAHYQRKLWDDLVEKAADQRT